MRSCMVRMFLVLAIIFAGAVPAVAAERKYRLDVDDNLVSIVESYDITLDGKSVKGIVVNYRGNTPAAVELGKLGAKARKKGGMNLLTVRGRTPSGYPRHKLQVTFILDGDGNPASIFRTKGMKLDEKWIKNLGFLSEVQVRKGEGVPADWYGALVRQGPKLIGIRHVNPDRWTLTRLTDDGTNPPPAPPVTGHIVLDSASGGSCTFSLVFDNLPTGWSVKYVRWTTWSNGQEVDQATVSGGDPVTLACDGADMATATIVFWDANGHPTDGPTFNLPLAH